LWSDQPKDGYVIADFATALGMLHEDQRAEQLFKQGMEVAKGTSGYRAILEEYGIFLQHRFRFGCQSARETSQ
jgi:hypothetical protein